MFPRLEREIDGVEGREAVMAVLEDPAFTEFRNINVLPLIYDAVSYTHLTLPTNREV